MAEVTSSSSKDTFSTDVAANTAPCVVAPPKFLFGSGISERVKKSDDDEDDDSDVSEKEEELESGNDFLEYASAALKRSADSRDLLDDFTDFIAAPKKMLKTESPDNGLKNENVLRPSALSDIANKLTNTQQSTTDDAQKSGNVEQGEKLAKTFGESSNSSTSSSECLTGLSRPHLIDTPAPLNTSTQSENYFHQFLTGNSLTSSTESKGAFVFGQNLRDRVSVEPVDSGSAEVPAKTPKDAGTPQSLADLADKDSSGSASSVEHETSHSQNSIAAAAQKYEREHTSAKQNLAKVNVMTGEEDERNVVQVNCRLFTFCKDAHSWLGKGRVILKLNDHIQKNSEGTFHSRIVARTQGSLRLVLNSKLWPDMVIEKASEKAIRISVMEDGNIQLYLVMAPAREAVQLYTAIDRRIRTLKSNETSTKEDSEDERPEIKHIPQIMDDEDDNKTKRDKEKEKCPKGDILSDSPNESEKN